MGNRVLFVSVPNMAIGKVLTRQKGPKIGCASFWSPGLDHAVSQNGEILDLRKCRMSRDEALKTIWEHVIQNRLEKSMPKIMFSYIPIKFYANKTTELFVKRRCLES